MTTPTIILRVAVASPLRQLFDYLPPADMNDGAASALPPGIRLRVPFGRRETIGILVAVAAPSPAGSGGEHTLKPIAAVLDETPALSPAILRLALWAAHYYQHPPGETLLQALPVALRKGEPAMASAAGWRLSARGHGLPEGALRRSPRQAEALALLQQRADWGEAELMRAGVRREHLRALADKGLVERCRLATDATPGMQPATTVAGPTLNVDQRRAIDSIAAHQGEFRCWLLEGVTGSGKTEVYLQLIAQTLAQGRQALVLVPEIGLTPQTLARFEQRVSAPIALLHSGLSERERLAAWRAARSGAARLILGTRSAIFADCPQLGLIIIDEEHDASYKQQDGFRYHARDAAIKCAADMSVPIVLGSATPSLETLQNAVDGKYGHLALPARAGSAMDPAIDLVDIRHLPLQDGLSAPAIAAVRETLARGEQALVFLNRRGFAPTLLCHDCGWIAGCRHCDARLTVHAAVRRLRCHHCGFQQPLPSRCDHCHGGALEYRGPGTERLEQALRQLFPAVPLVRVDRDTTSRKGALRELLAEAARGEPCILVGTQMLAKGHHFPGVTLVVMVDADGGLFSADFRGPERMGQVVTQVAGRSGRGDQPGTVLIQTHYPDHPLLTSLVRDGYHRFARGLLDERRQRSLPPFSHLALVRADGRDLREAETLLGDLRQQLSPRPVTAVGPLPAPLSRRAGLFRAQLLLQADRRGLLHEAIGHLLTGLTNHPLARRVRCSVDIDPIDLS